LVQTKSTSSAGRQNKLARHFVIHQMMEMSL